MLTLCCAAVDSCWDVRLPNDNQHQYEEGNDPSLAYIYFINMHKVIILPKQYYVQPYLVGKDKRSLALILPAKLVKALNINPLIVLFLLKVIGGDQLQLIVVRQEHLERKAAGDVTYAADDATTKQEVDLSS